MSAFDDPRAGDVFTGIGMAFEAQCRAAFSRLPRKCKVGVVRVHPSSGAAVTWHPGTPAASADKSATYDIDLMLPAVNPDDGMSRREAATFAAYAVHELCHVLHTDLTVFGAYSRRGPMHKHTLNALEDARIERRVIRDRTVPGGRALLLPLAEYLVDKAGADFPAEVGKDRLAAMPFLLALACREYGIGAVEAIVANLPRRMAAALAVALPAVRAAKCTADLIPAADAILALWPQPAAVPPPPVPNPDPTPGEPGEGEEGEGQGGMSDPGVNAPKDDGAEDADEQGEGEDADGDGDDGEQGEQGAGSSTPVESSPGSEGAQGDGSDGDGDDDDDGDTGEGSGDADGEGDDDGEGDGADGEDGEGDAGDDVDPDADADGAGGSGAGAGGEEDHAAAAGEIDSGKLNPEPARAAEDLAQDVSGEQASTFEGEMQAHMSPLQWRKVKATAEGNAAADGFARAAVKEMKASPVTVAKLARALRSPRRSWSDRKLPAGRLDPTRLSRVGVEDPLVFVRRGEIAGTETALAILADASGSMSGRKARHAARASYALASIFTGMRLPVEVGLFKDSPDASIYVVKGRNEQLRKTAGAFAEMAGKAAGGTPDTEAVRAYVRKIARWPEARRVLIVITDGVGSMGQAQQDAALDEAKRRGVQVYGVGIEVNEHALEGRYPGRAVAVDDLPTLPVKLAQVLLRAAEEYERAKAGTA